MYHRKILELDYGIAVIHAIGVVKYYYDNATETRGASTSSRRTGVILMSSSAFYLCDLEGYIITWWSLWKIDRMLFIYDEGNEDDQSDNQMEQDNPWFCCVIAADSPNHYPQGFSATTNPAEVNKNNQHRSVVMFRLCLFDDQYAGQRDDDQPLTADVSPGCNSNNVICNAYYVIQILDDLRMFYGSTGQKRPLEGHNEEQMNPLSFPIETLASEELLADTDTVTAACFEEHNHPSAQVFRCVLNRYAFRTGSEMLVQPPGILGPPPPIPVLLYADIARACAKSKSGYAAFKNVLKTLSVEHQRLALGQHPPPPFSGQSPPDQILPVRGRAQSGTNSISSSNNAKHELTIHNYHESHVTTSNAPQQLSPQGLSLPFTQPSPPLQNVMIYKNKGAHPMECVNSTAAVSNGRGGSGGYRSDTGLLFGPAAGSAKYGGRVRRASLVNHSGNNEHSICCSEAHSSSSNESSQERGYQSARGTGTQSENNNLAFSKNVAPTYSIENDINVSGADVTHANISPDKSIAPRSISLTTVRPPTHPYHPNTEITQEKMSTLHAHALCSFSRVELQELLERSGYGGRGGNRAMFDAYFLDGGQLCAACRRALGLHPRSPMSASTSSSSPCNKTLHECCSSYVGENQEPVINSSKRYSDPSHFRLTANANGRQLAESHDIDQYDGFGDAFSCEDFTTENDHDSDASINTSHNRTNHSISSSGSSSRFTVKKS